MTAQVDLETASQLFDTEVTLRYQNAQFLKDVIQERHGTTGDATNVPVSDLIEMQNQSFAPTDIPVTPVDETNKMIVPYNYALKTVIGGGEKTLFAYNKIVDHAKMHSEAVGRMLDYIKINALYTDPNVSDITVIPVDTGSNTGVNEGKIAAGLSQLENNGIQLSDGVGNMMCSLWLPAITKKSMLNDEKVVNLFYNDRRPLTDYQLPNYLGVKICTLGAAGINTIPYTSAGSPVINTYEVPLVHKDSMVQTFNRDPMTSITWVQQQDRYELLSVMTSGAKIIQTAGIVLLEAENPFAPNA